MTSEEEKRLIILSAIASLGGSATKGAVLDQIANEDLMVLTDHDREWRKSRKELVWRNDLAFIRGHLVDEGLMSRSEDGQWEISSAGSTLAQRLARNARQASNLRHINANSLDRMSLWLDASMLSDEDALTGDTRFVEGASVLHWGTRYERDPQLRKRAIELHGLTCQGCGFDFASHYGALGQGFIEVHHLMPLSELEGPTSVNPMTDLAVLCSNCHSMVHRQKPHPLSLSELRELIAHREPSGR